MISQNTVIIVKKKSLLIVLNSFIAMAPQNISPLCWSSWGCKRVILLVFWTSISCRLPSQKGELFFYKLAHADLQNQNSNEAQHERVGGRGLPGDDNLPDTHPAISIFATGSAGHHVQCNWWHYRELLRTRGKTEGRLHRQCDSMWSAVHAVTRLSCFQTSTYSSQN